ncbi:MAG TPA: MarC family protein [Candidatus Bathyarchaeia archaeon]|nr:MarC family protein [Candidatus Bathyarchaeia archaeon]
MPAEIASLDFISELTRAFVALFIIVDPFGNIPIFVGLTENITDAQRKKTYNTAILVGFALLLVFSFTGQEILSLFGLSIYSFEVAGGILLLIIAIRILISGFHESTESPESLGAVPIAIPLLVGPGAITTTIFNLQSYGTIITILAVVVVLALTWVILRFINGFYKVLGKTGAIVIARVMALLIAAIAVQYILTGVTHFIA